MIVFIFGPTGAGKTEIISRLIERRKLLYVTSQMTRPLRPGETDKEYISESLFTEREAAGDFIWTSQLFGYRYGTPRNLVKEALSSPISTHVLDFPIESIAQIEDLDGYKIGILIMPPSKEVLIARLKVCNRQYRIDKALEQFDKYRNAIVCGLSSIINGRVIVNEDLEVTYANVIGILSRTW